VADILQQVEKFKEIIKRIEYSGNKPGSTVYRYMQL